MSASQQKRNKELHERIAGLEAEARGVRAERDRVTAERDAAERGAATMESKLQAECSSLNRAIDERDAAIKMVRDLEEWQAKHRADTAEVLRERDAARAEVEALRDDQRRAFKVAYSRTLDCQTSEEMAAALVTMVDDARSRAEQAESAAAAMRVALTTAVSVLDSVTTPITLDMSVSIAEAIDEANAALSTDAGKSLVEELERLREAERTRPTATEWTELLTKFRRTLAACQSLSRRWREERSKCIGLAEDLCVVESERDTLRSRVSALEDAAIALAYEAKDDADDIVALERLESVLLESESVRKRLKRTAEGALLPQPPQTSASKERE